MNLLRIILLSLAIVLLVFGFVVCFILRPAMTVTPDLRFAPIWKQRPLFSSPREYKWYLAGSISLASGSLFVAIAIFMGFA